MSDLEQARWMVNCRVEDRAECAMFAKIRTERRRNVVLASIFLVSCIVIGCKLKAEHWAMTPGTIIAPPSTNTAAPDLAKPVATEHTVEGALHEDARTLGTAAGNIRVSISPADAPKIEPHVQKIDDVAADLNNNAGLLADNQKLLATAQAQGVKVKAESDGWEANAKSEKAAKEAEHAQYEKERVTREKLEKALADEKESNAKAMHLALRLLATGGLIFALWAALMMKDYTLAAFGGAVSFAALTIDHYYAQIVLAGIISLGVLAVGVVIVIAYRYWQAKKRADAEKVAHVETQDAAIDVIQAMKQSLQRKAPEEAVKFTGDGALPGILRNELPQEMQDRVAERKDDGTLHPVVLEPPTKKAA